MKLNVALVLAGILILSAGCARKCPVCPTCDATGSMSSFTAPAPSYAAAPSAPVSNNAVSSASKYSSGTGRYVSK